MLKIKKGDNVVMLSGKDKGKKGKVARIFPQERKAIVEGLNLLTKHVRPRREGEKGQKIQVPRAITIAKIMLVCPKCSKPSRTSWNLEGDKKERVCKKCGRTI